jgi:RNA polymerase sigma factor (sigma-70 family)
MKKRRGWSLVAIVTSLCASFSENSFKTALSFCLGLKNKLRKECLPKPGLAAHMFFDPSSCFDKRAPGREYDRGSGKEAVFMDRLPDCARVERLVRRLTDGDDSAVGELITHACQRMRRLTRKMLSGFQRLRRWEETDDVLQNAMMRLHRALQKVKPPSPRDFFSLASTQIRRELIDLSRHHFGPHGFAYNYSTSPGDGGAGDSPSPRDQKEDVSHEPARLARWREFHEQVAALPPEERGIFDLLWYQGLTQTRTAAVLGITERTVQRRWQSARLRLYDALHGELPV